MLENIFRVFNTIKYLKPAQLVSFILRRKFKARFIEFHGEVLPRSKVSFYQPLTINNIWLDKRSFVFLNIKKTLDGEIPWKSGSVPRLWNYNLHYFDFLRQENRSISDKTDIINEWIDYNPQGSEPAWEPFTTSLRIVNWIFFLSLNPSAITEKILNSLYVQCLWLEKNDERHILANHYFENLKALAFAGAFFDGVEANRWRRKACENIFVQLSEQTLADGGHYERTPQYHAHMVENYLDLYNLFLNNPTLFDDQLVSKCKDKAYSGMNFLSEIVFPDESIPLFNDSAFNISPSVSELDNYFCNLTGSSARISKHEKLITLPESGIFGYRNDNNMFVIDAGDIGPSYQPGHTHCDMLSYELMWSGERIIVDTGVYEYEPGEMRKYVRSTRAHNTVSIDEQEQSEVWGEFRVARRARILKANIKHYGNRVTFKGAYRGFPALRRSFFHNRKVILELDSDENFSTLNIEDRIVGRGMHKVESFIHLHPDMTLDECAEDFCQIKSKKGQLFQIQWDKTIHCIKESAFYCPEFGLKVSNIRLVLRCKAKLPLTLNYTIKKI